MVGVVTAVRRHADANPNGVRGSAMGSARWGEDSPAGVHPDQGPGWVLQGVSESVPLGRAAARIDSVWVSMVPRKRSAVNVSGSSARRCLEPSW